MVRSFLAFSAVGMLITVLSASTYWLIVSNFGLDANLSLLIVFVIFTVLGHLLHGLVSFRSQTKGVLIGRSFRRFIVVNMIGFALNQLFVYGIVKYLDLPVWGPIFPMVLVTPAIIFVLSRFWVFIDQGAVNENQT